MTINNKICCVCQKINSSYKCSICKESYCSLACYKTHKLTPCHPEKVESCIENKKDEKVYEFPTDDTVPITKLAQLKESDEVKNCLKNPHVKDIINAILKSDNPSSTIELAMKEPIFIELADACLKIVESSDRIIF